MLIADAHGKTHEGKRLTYNKLSQAWAHPYLKAMIDNYVTDCHTCNVMNPAWPYTSPMGRFPVPPAPFSEIVKDFTDMRQDCVCQG